MSAEHVEEKPIESQFLSDSRRPEGKTHSVGVREERKENPLFKPGGSVFLAALLLQIRAERFDETSVLHAGWTGGFAGSAIETEVDVAFEFGREGQSSV